MKQLIYCLALLCPLFSNCQQITIKGNVINEEGNPIPAATITIKGTTNSTVANAKGEFTLSNTKLNDTIMVSAIGYQTAIEPNNMRGLITVILKRKITELDETIIMAYGTTTKRLNTGNISKVTAAEIAAQPISNPLAALYGRVPGLEITQNSGMPGAGFKLMLRGQNSITQGVEPLIVIDGVPFLNGNSQLNQVTNAANGGLSPLNTINHASIESIEVLKDADATAIYGSRGANGVILITTKKAAAGKLTVTATCKTGFSRATRSVSMLTTKEYLSMRREAFANDGITPTIANAPDLLLWDTTTYTNFSRLFTGGTATFNDAQLSVGAASAGTSFQLGLSYNRETSVFSPAQNGRRYAGNLSIGHTAANKKFSISAMLAFSIYNSSLLSNDLTAFINMPPHFQLYDKEGKINWEMGNTNISSFGGLSNPLSLLNRKFEGSSATLLANITLSYNITKQLTARFTNGFQQQHNSEEFFFPRSSFNPNISTLASAEFASARMQNLLSEPQLEYNNRLGQLRLSVLAGASFQQAQNRSGRIVAENYTSDLMLTTPSAAGTVRVRDGYSLYRYTAGFARINIHWKETWVLNLSARRDGSSRFGPARRFANFGAVGAAWIFSNEKFIKQASFISFGKLRLSLGVTGNDQVGDYQYINTWSPSPFTYQGSSALQPSRLYNEDYTWEKNTKTEAGLELGFFNNRILLFTAAYRNRCGNQLINYTLPVQTGFTSVLQNFNAEIENKGFECTLTSKNIASARFSWTTVFNFSRNSNKLLSFPGVENTSYRSSHRVGYPLNTVAVFRYLAVDPLTGINSFFDANADGLINQADRVSLQNTATRFFGSIINSFNYSGFELRFLFEYRKQPGKNYLATQGTFVPGYFYYNQPSFVLQRWQSPGQQASMQRFVAVTTSPAFASAQTLLTNSDAVYSDASFIRLRNVSLTYRLPQKIAAKFKSAETALFLQAQNLFTITAYKGADPENQNMYTMPPLRTIVAGFTIHL